MNLTPSLGTVVTGTPVASTRVEKPEAPAPAPVDQDKRGRRHSAARRIAAALLEDPAMLGLRTRLLIVDIRARFKVGRSTAGLAVAIARRWA